MITLYLLPGNPGGGPDGGGSPGGGPSGPGGRFCLGINPGLPGGGLGCGGLGPGGPSYEIQTFKNSFFLPKILYYQLHYR